MSTIPPSYRIFVGAFPGGELADRLQSLRQRWDAKTARITPPHVTLAGTYTRIGLPTPGGEIEAITSLSQLNRSVEPFKMVLGGIGMFPPTDQPVIYVRVELNPELIKIRKLLIELLGPDKHSRFTPHLTLAMRLQGEGARRAVRAIQKSEWAKNKFIIPITELRLMQRSSLDDAWRCIATFSLSNNGSSACNE